jgi:fructosamine-3-kinase
VAIYRKRYRPDQAGSPALEAAGLAWLGATTAAGGVQVPAVYGIGREEIRMERIEPGPASLTAARAFGRALAHTHAAGAPHVGAPPPGWDQATGSIGLAPLPFATTPPGTWGEFYADYRIEPYVRWARAVGGLGAGGVAVFADLAERLRAGDFDAPQPDGVPAAARTHGDLWSGNVLWTAPTGGDGWTGAVVIDPAAHGAHAETDLAMLALFGVPHLDAILAAYDAIHPLAPGWRQRVGLHQLHPLLVHATLFGPSYGARAVAVAGEYLSS